MPRLSVEHVQAPTGGMNVAADPSLLPADQCQDLLNTIPRPGYVRNRGGMTRVAASATAGPLMPVGVIPYGPGAYAVAFRDTAAAVTLQMLNVGLSTATSVTSTSTDKVPMGRGVSLGFNAYAHGMGVNHVLLYVNGPTTGNDFGCIELTTGPAGVDAIAVHQQRLFCITGMSLVWSDVGGPTSDVATAWQDDYTGLTNNIPLPEYIIAMMSVGPQQLVLLSERRMWILRGSGPATWTLELVADIGCVSPYAITRLSDRIVFFSREGLYSFDGVSVPHLHSDAVGPLLRPALSTIGGWFQEYPGRQGWALVEAVGDHTVAVSIGTRSGGVSSVYPTFAGLYHMEYNAWNRVNSPLSTMVAGDTGAWGWLMPAAMSSAALTTLSYPLLWDGGAVFILDNIMRPEVQGSDRIGSTLAAPAISMTARRLKLAAPLNRAQLHRVVADLASEPSSAVPWNLRIDRKITEAGIVYAQPVTLSTPGVLAGPGTPLGSNPGRTVVDVFDVVANVDVVWARDAVATGATFFNVGIFDTYVMFQPAYDQTG